MDNTTTTSSAATTGIEIPPDILVIVGPLLLGGLFSFCLYGISIVQLYIYYLSFPGDMLWIQITVYMLFVLDTFQSTVTCALTWSAMCSGWGRPEALEVPGWGFSAIPAVSGIVSAWVQCFFAWRIYVLGKWRLIPGAIVMLALAQASGGLAAGIRFVPLKVVTELHVVYPMVCVWLGGSALVDVLVAVSMVYLVRVSALSLDRARALADRVSLRVVHRVAHQLYAAKKNADGNNRTERMLTRLIRMTVETGVVTAAAASLDLGLFLGFRNNNLHTLLAFMLCKLYTNSLMASLNSRSPLFKANPTTHFGSASQVSSVAHYRWRSATTASQDSSAATSKAVHISQYVEVTRDGEDRKPDAHVYEGTESNVIPMMNLTKGDDAV
ncbi:hypothetical protein HETIRDRAFT_458327, partial [Heterobasidion irregulare TC 32-1]